MEFRDDKTLFWNWTKVNFARAGAALDRTEVDSNNAQAGPCYIFVFCIAAVT
jgi:hypothetical protein